MSETLNLSHVELLARVDLFASFDRHALARLAAFVDPLPVEADTAVCRQGDAADGLYVVARGAFIVSFTGPDGGETDLATIHPGDVFGEMGLLAGAARTATVRAVTPGELLYLESSRFLDLLRREPSMAPAIIATLSRRLQASNQALQQREHLLSRAAEQTLGDLDPTRRQSVLEATMVSDRSPPVLAALFGDRAESVARDLADLGLDFADSRDSVARTLRQRLVERLRPDELERVAATIVERLSAGRCWSAALEVAERFGRREAYLATLGRALRADPTPAPDEALRWLAAVTDDEAVQDAAVARQRAAVYERGGQLEAAQELLRRASANVSGGAVAPAGEPDSKPTHPATAPASPVSPAPESTKRSGRVVAGGVARWRPRTGTLVTLMVAGALTIAAASLAEVNPQFAFIALLAAAMAFWLSNIVPLYAVSIGLVVAWMILGLASPTEAMSGFATSNWLFVVAVLGLATAVARSGLLYRAGLLVVRRMPSHLFGRAATLLLTGVLVSPLLPQSSPRAALIGPLSLAVAEASRLRDREPAAAVLGLAAWIGASPMSFLFLNGSPNSLLAWGLLPVASRERFDWLFWLLAAAPVGALVILGSLVALFLLLRPGPAVPIARERVNTQLAVLGPLSRREWAMVVVLGLTVVGWLIVPASTLNAGALAALGFLAAVITGNLDQKSIRELDWDFILFYGVAVSIASQADRLDIGQLEASAISPWLAEQALHPAMVVLALTLAAIVVQIVLAKELAILLVIITLVPEAPALGVDPWVVVLIFLATSSLWFFPSQTPAYLVFYSTMEGRLFSHREARRVAFAFSGVMILSLLLVVPYWHRLGLL